MTKRSFSLHFTLSKMSIFCQMDMRTGISITFSLQFCHSCLNLICKRMDRTSLCVLDKHAFVTFQQKKDSHENSTHSTLQNFYTRCFSMYLFHMPAKQYLIKQGALMPEVIQWGILMSVGKHGDIIDRLIKLTMSHTDKILSGTNGISLKSISLAIWPAHCEFVNFQKWRKPCFLLKFLLKKLCLCN